MKKLFLVISLTAVLCLTGCSNKNDDNINNTQNQNVVNENTQNQTNDNVNINDDVQNQVENNLVDIDKENVSGDEIASLYLNQISKWEPEYMPEDGKSGLYSTGYCFIDINNDGIKELAVQQGGGSLQNCTTEFYELQNDIVKKCEFNSKTVTFTSGDIESIAIDDLKKYRDENGNEFYINTYTLKSDENEYITHVDKMFVEDKILRYEVLFIENQTTTEDGEPITVYFEADPLMDFEFNGVSESKYQESYENYFNSLTELEVIKKFINSADWDKMTDEEKQKALAESYNA